MYPSAYKYTNRFHCIKKMITKKDIKKILIIRFRQIGDSILAAAMCSSLKQSFPDSEIHIVLNERIAPIFDYHPDIDKVITFTNDENKKIFKYIRKIISVVRETKYDVIIDMRSTIRTLFFSLFSLRTPIRIGRKKNYTFLLNRRIESQTGHSSMVEDNQLYANALKDICDITNTPDFRLYVSNEEKERFRNYMIDCGIDFGRPVILIGTTTKLLDKRWNPSYMKEIIKRLLQIKEIQILFNYAPGREEEECRKLYEELDCPKNIKIEIKAGSIRELMALAANSTFYFGNEGGTRHLVQALGVPSFAIFSPGAAKFKWLPQNNTPADGIDFTDIKDIEECQEMSREEIYNLITPDIVWQKLSVHMAKIYKQPQ